MRVSFILFAHLGQILPWSYYLHTEASRSFEYRTQVSAEYFYWLAGLNAIQLVFDFVFTHLCRY
jgi:hypothetical protein